jgi:hypothetical protein
VGFRELLSPVAQLLNDGFVLYVGIVLGFMQSGEVLGKPATALRIIPQSFLNTFSQKPIAFCPLPVLPL